MTSPTPFLAAIVLGYGLGNIQTSYILGRFIQKKDIRNEGSGNAGASNVVLVMGWRWGAVTFLIDVLKATVAYSLSLSLFGLPDAALLSGLGAVLGHIFPVIMRFKGGKGISSIVGLLFAVQPLFALKILGLTGFALFLFNYVALATLVPLAALPILIIYLPYSPWVILPTMAVTWLSLFLHWGNFKRIFRGEETAFRSFFIEKLKRRND